MTATHSANAQTGPVTDTLLSCLAYITNFHGLPFSSEVARAGLPLEKGLLTPLLATRAAERCGLHARMVKRKASRVSELVLPVILAFSDETFAVLISRSQREKTAEILVAGQSDIPVKISLAELDNKSLPMAIYLAPVQTTDTNSPFHDGSKKGHWFWSVVIKFWPSWLQILLAALCTNLLALAAPLFVMNVYDRVIPNNAIPTLIALLVGVGIALFFDFLLKQARTTILDHAARRADMRLGAEIFEHALAISMEKRPATSGGVATKIQGFETVRDFFTSSAIISALDFLFIGVFLYVLWIITGPLVYIPALAVPVVVVITLLCQIPLSGAVEKTMSSASERQSLLFESMTGLFSIRAAAAEGQMQRRWEQTISRNAQAATSVRSWTNFVSNIVLFIHQLVSICIVSTGVFLVAKGDITLGSLIAANILAGRVLAPLSGVSQTLSRAKYAFSAMRQLTELMQLTTERGVGHASGRQLVTPSITFEKVSFTYPNSPQNSLNEISFKINMGEHVAIVGPIGAGKSTIGRLLAGFYEPQNGIILLDQIDIRQYDKAVIRKTVGLVNQEPELFIGTIRENIVMGNPMASEALIKAAADTCGVSNFTARHPQGLDLPVGEHGRNLSGGQRQAIALARIILRQPNILFLDEPTSAMDLQQEKNFITQMSKIAKAGVTLIISTHRPSLLALAQRVIVVQDGKVTQDGPRDTVLTELKKQNNLQQIPEPLKTS